MGATLKNVRLENLPLNIQLKKGSKVWWVDTNTGKFIHKDNLWKYTIQ